MFEISAWCKTINNNPQHVATGVHKQLDVLSVIAVPLLEHLRRNGLVGLLMTGAVVDAPLQYSLQCKLIEHDVGMFVFNVQDVTHQHRY